MMDVSAVEIGTYLLQLGAIAAVYLKVQKAVREMAGKGEPREIMNDPLRTQDAPRTATIDDLKLQGKRITALELRLDEHIKSSQASNHDLQESIGDLRDKVDDRMQTVSDDLRELTRAVGRLEGS